MCGSPRKEQGGLRGMDLPPSTTPTNHPQAAQGKQGATVRPYAHTPVSNNVVCGPTPGGTSWPIIVCLLRLALCTNTATSAVIMRRPATQGGSCCLVSSSPSAMHK